MIFTLAQNLKMTNIKNVFLNGLIQVNYNSIIYPTVSKYNRRLRAFIVLFAIIKINALLKPVIKNIFKYHLYDMKSMSAITEKI